MKTIYDLTIGDSYWVKMPERDIHGYFTGRIRAHERWLDEDDRDSINDPLNSSQQLKMAIDMGIAFMTKEECQRSIDYDIAMAKIKQRASELEGQWEPNLKEPYTVITNFDGVIVLDLLVEEIGFILSFKELETAHAIIKELPEECKIVLGVE